MPCQSADQVHFTAFPGRLAASVAPSSSPFRAQLRVAFPLTRGHHRAACARAGVWEGEVRPLRTLQRGSAAKQGAE